ncbi:SRPBCC family protein [Nocardia sp. JW2]|uniref:SRPBCC family protein n=1 Tax=Nocardia coubleae TaxID=356147 RepID=A0A846W342_9NOCA|nr:SRPBCC family protein [Nocardia coubleae]NKX87210.1 SRPBCC family protein [Nocardia coubleae]
MSDVRIVEDCAAPAETAFAFVNDYRNLPKFWYGIESFTPVTEQTEGVGAKFDGKMKLGPASLTSRIEVVRWEEGSVIGTKSIKGFEILSTFVFTPKGADTSTIDAHIQYFVPGGIAGKMLGRTIEPFIKIAVKHTTEALISEIEKAHRPTT